MQFLDLPVEILPEILTYVIKPHHLAAACLVNQTFRRFAVPLLYESIRIYSWHREGKAKVMLLFDTLARHGYLAMLVKRLEIRDFPKAITILDTDVLNHVLRGLKNCANLGACTWTRDGSLNSDILETLTHCSEIRELEFNGHNEGNYDPRLLLSFTKLNRISIIMPSGPVLAQLKPWLSVTGSTLRSLTLICKTTSLVTDSLIETLAPHLVNLEYLHLAGCPKVTEKGVWAAVSSNRFGLLGLGLEGLSNKFDMQALSGNCVSTGALDRLRSITLTINHQVNLQEWVDSVILLVSRSPVRLFQIYSTGVFFESPDVDQSGVYREDMQSMSELRAIVYRVGASIAGKVCSDKLAFAALMLSSKGRLSKLLALAKRLRTLHINYPVEASTEDVSPIMRPDEVLEIVRQCPSIVHVGCNTRVWQVSHKITHIENGEIISRPFLTGYESTEIPEQFLVGKAVYRSPILRHQTLLLRTYTTMFSSASRHRRAGAFRPRQRRHAHPTGATSAQAQQSSHEEEPEIPPMFYNCHHFNIMGGVFNNYGRIGTVIVNYHAQPPVVPSATA
ncbi:hypothetical protein CVT24_009172 [Panaeolus cyanescens]|uniref:Uncharacterized protein n=1 Tax=Panaeolus cyanescens TaxID=181874 RepID=A0A409Y8P2_9AGAR|nr:hypothetical protein CVT24_009172 [Panaeolus cyanescens]